MEIYTIYNNRSDEIRKSYTSVMGDAVLSFSNRANSRSKRRRKSQVHSRKIWSEDLLDTRNLFSSAASAICSSSGPINSSSSSSSSVNNESNVIVDCVTFCCGLVFAWSAVFNDCKNSNQRGSYSSTPVVAGKSCWWLGEYVCEGFSWELILSK